MLKKNDRIPSGGGGDDDTGVNNMHKGKRRIRNKNRESSRKSSLNRDNNNGINFKQTSLPSNLLLAYTYFLNPDHSCFITIGYDAITFEMKIILMKNKKFQEWSINEWYHLYQNAQEIQRYFESNSNNVAVSSTLKKVINISNDMTGITIQFDHSDKKLMIFDSFCKIVIMSNEWYILYSLLNFINSIVNHYYSSSQQIECYFIAYSNKCKQMRTSSLPLNEFFLFSSSFCNFSRLFNEIPVICCDKLNE